MEVEIIKFDNLGRGLGYLDNLIIFVPKSVPGDILDVEVVLKKKNYQLGKIKKIIKPSNLRIKPICPYFFTCGGCDLMHISLNDMLNYKINKVNDIFKQNKINYEVDKINKSLKIYNYRNKISLKIKDEVVGYYETNTHDLVKIDNCYLANNIINKVIKNIYLLRIKNGEIIIRSNYQREVLIIINSLDKIENIDEFTNLFNIKGIILNDKAIYGQNYFYEKINDYLFKVSYNSFFQVNCSICSLLFSKIKKYSQNSSKILDLYCGVGTLSLVVANNENYVLGVEIVKNAIKDANHNRKLNKKENVKFICSDTLDIINKIDNSFDLVILDPPRSGVKKEILEKIKKEKIENIIYVSCNPLTLARDLKILVDLYEMKNIELFDMFVNCEHIEVLTYLHLKNSFC